jgi:hypothetical protein
MAQTRAPSGPSQSRSGRASSVEKNFPASVEAAVATRPAEETRPVFKLAQDEGRFGRMLSPKRAWAPAGIRPKAPRQVLRELSSVSAAVAPEHGLLTSLILPEATPEMMDLFVAQVAEDFAEYLIVRQLEQAGWHRTKEWQVPEHIRVLFQPAYSPEVNPGEHLWEDIREKYLHNRVFPS